MPRSSSLLLLLLASCWLSTEEVGNKIDASNFADADADADADTDPSVIEIVDVVPDYGSEDGGTEVTIEATHLDPTVQVYFDGVAASVVDSSGSEVVVVTPEAKGDGPVDIRVTTDRGTGDKKGAYTYWLAGQNKIAAFGAVHWDSFQGGYWANGDARGSGWFMFIEPVNADYSDTYGDTIDGCVSGHAFDTDQLTKYPAGGPIELRSGSVSLDFFYAKQSNLYLVNLSNGDFKSTAGYDLQPLGDNAKAYWPDDMFVADFVRTASPIRILVPDVDGADAGSIWPSTNLELQWDNPASGDYVVAQIDRWIHDGIEYVHQEEVRCLLRDDGSHTVPFGVWNGWDTVNPQYLGIALGRVAETSAAMPHNEGRSGVAGIYWTNGAVFTTQP